MEVMTELWQQRTSPLLKGCALFLWFADDLHFSTVIKVTVLANTQLIRFKIFYFLL